MWPCWLWEGARQTVVNDRKHLQLVSAAQGPSKRFNLRNLFPHHPFQHFQTSLAIKMNITQIAASLIDLLGCLVFVPIPGKILEGCLNSQPRPVGCSDALLLLRSLPNISAFHLAINFPLHPGGGTICHGLRFQASNIRAQDRRNLKKDSERRWKEKFSHRIGTDGIGKAFATSELRGWTRNADNVPPFRRFFNWRMLCISAGVQHWIRSMVSRHQVGSVLNISTDLQLTKSYVL